MGFSIFLYNTVRHRSLMQQLCSFYFWIQIRGYIIIKKIDVSLSPLRGVSKIALGNLLHPSGTQNTCGSLFEVQLIVFRSPTVTPRINNAGSWRLSLLTLCGVGAVPYQRYAELAPPQSTMRTVYYSPYPHTKDIDGQKLSYQRYAESATPRVNDMRCWRLPESLLRRVDFDNVISRISNSNPKRRQKLCKDLCRTDLYQNLKKTSIGIFL